MLSSDVQFGMVSRYNQMSCYTVKLKRLKGEWFQLIMINKALSGGT